MIEQEKIDLNGSNDIEDGIDAILEKLIQTFGTQAGLPILSVGADVNQDLRQKAVDILREAKVLP